MLESAIERLEASGKSIHALVEAMSEETLHWKPKPEVWSVHEVVCHLLDEERDDFRARFFALIEDPSREWAPIDPEGWPKSRNYAGRDFEETLAAWWSERQDSLRQLRELAATESEPRYENDHPMPWGKIRAGDFLSSWVAHDLLHLRQILRLRFESIPTEFGDYSTLYAGEW